MPMTTRNHALDILRAIAILMVLTTHLANSFVGGTTFAKAVSVGGRGVDLFFVLSGWLLGSQLFREAQNTGTIDVKRFWIRRWLRTLPAYYAVLLATFVQFLVTHKSDLIDWRYLFFAQNYLAEQKFLGVTWSLCVEEHFYLVIAPALLVGVRYRWARIVGVMALMSLVGVHIAGGYQFRPEFLIVQTHIVFEQCAMGVFLAWLSIHRPNIWNILNRRVVPLVFVSILFYVLAIVNRTVWDWWLPNWGTGGWAVLFATWVLFASGQKVNRERWWLRPFSLIALRAYSLYLVHTDAIALAKKLPVPSLIQVVLAVVLAFLAAELLYRLVERPFSKLRDRGRLAKKSTPETTTV
jgi:peptidoglycan/LPS O-acetylase OafA/YrhL